MKRSLLVILILFSTVYGAEDQTKEIEALKTRVAHLERLVAYLIQSKRLTAPNCQTPTQSTRKRYRVTLYDDTTFLIYKWDRVSTKRRDAKGKLYYKKQYVMYDVFGKKRVWSCDKVDSIEPVEDE